MYIIVKFNIAYFRKIQNNKMICKNIIPLSILNVAIKIHLMIGSIVCPVTMKSTLKHH